MLKWNMLSQLAREVEVDQALFPFYPENLFPDGHRPSSRNHAIALDKVEGIRAFSSLSGVQHPDHTQSLGPYFCHNFLVQSKSVQ